MPKVEANGIELFYNIQGAGEPLLLIAGFSCDCSFWLAMLPSLVEQYQVIRFDNRGSGQSSAPDSPYTIQQMAADAAALLDALSIAKVHVAGHSMGGQIAQELTLAVPEKVQSLMLLSSLAKSDGKLHTLVEMLGDLPGKVDAELYWKVLLPWLVTDEVFDTPGAIEQAIEMLLENPFLPTPHGLYHQSRAVLASDTSHRLKDIRCPALVLVGKEDILTPVKFSLELAQGIPNAELVILERGGHSLAEIVEAVTQVMLNFLAKLQL